VPTQGGPRLCALADDSVTIDQFGASVLAEMLLREFGLTAEHATSRARELLPTSKGA
jgi:transketolase